MHFPESCILCFQIQIPSDEFDSHVPNDGRLSIRFTNNLAMPDGEGFSIEYGEPIQLDWKGSSAVLQPCKAVLLEFNPITTEGKLTPEFR